MIADDTVSGAFGPGARDVKIRNLRKYAVHTVVTGVMQVMNKWISHGILGRNSSLVVFELAVHSVAGLILLWGNFLIEGIFPLELTWVQTPSPPPPPKKNLFRMRV